MAKAPLPALCDDGGDDDNLNLLGDSVVYQLKVKATYFISLAKFPWLSHLTSQSLRFCICS